MIVVRSTRRVTFTVGVDGREFDTSPTFCRLDRGVVCGGGRGAAGSVMVELFGISGGFDRDDDGGTALLHSEIFLR